ncbi:thioredoxin family protein [Rosettibacter firmus]|uniref:thioredoxin family protein n=1 Tax=Rosettibacter firmus TaxID=3111522 RepID=UPI00336C2076
MAVEFFLKNKLINGINYNEYFNSLKNKIELIEKNNLKEINGYPAELYKLNYQRSTRIEKTYKVNEELMRLIKYISEQYWLIITEHWCGDSAQIVPYISKIAECNEKINLIIIERDKNLDIMDMYLTNGTRSIPKLIAFDYDGKELFQWGPRPKEAQELINKAKAEGKSKKEFLELLHKWYAKDKGKSIEKEFYEIINSLINHYNQKEK